MTSIGRMIACVVVAMAAIAPAVLVRAADVQLAPTIHHRMSRYVDAKYRFSFWYPSVLRITVAATNDDSRFPGGVLVETLQVRPAGGISLYVVNSPQSTITDEPNGHAAPIPQTKYFYDTASQRWMVTYPEGTGGGSAAPAPADVSKTTIGGQPMLPSGARFDTTIIPLSTTQFVVVQDGGGSEFTNELARTIAAADAHVDAAALSAALRAEALAYEGQLQITISPSTLCLLQSSSPCKK